MGCVTLRMPFLLLGPQFSHHYSNPVDSINDFQIVFYRALRVHGGDLSFFTHGSITASLLSFILYTGACCMISYEKRIILLDTKCLKISG